MFVDFAWSSQCRDRCGTTMNGTHAPIPTLPNYTMCEL